MKRAIPIALAAAALVLAIGLGWAFFKRTQELERRLGDANRQAEALGRSAQSQARDVDRALQVASAARETSEAAAQKAIEAAAGRISAETRTQAAEQAKELAEEEAQQSRQELTEIQKRREQELNRMHEALARIAATRRTSSGLVIDLTNDSFHFDFDKAALRPQNREILSRIAGVLLASNGYRLFIDGHADDLGSEEYNQQLSKRRAESVGSYLVAAGIDHDVIETRGFGKASPRAGGRTSEARQTNRRVEIVLVDSVVHYEGEVTGAARADPSTR